MTCCPPGPAPDHPRSRGVYPDFIFSKAFLIGSSPLARGLREPFDLRIRLIRIIPARAGFTLTLCLCSYDARDHPRSRGVYLVLRRERCVWLGSSPLARGLHVDARRGARQRRIIPARAGFTRARPRAWRRLPDHPRSRGVYALGRVWTENPVGSSPLARGLPRRGLRLSRFPRIIPARAGFTTRGRGPPPAPRDHPRSRGVYPGSSRRARCPPDHPRSRGVYSCHAFACPDHTGSSPLARGLQSHCRRLQTALRIIPARAGFTPLRWGWRLRRQDHPRSRGVYPRRRPGPTSPVGSSPLARGLLIAYWFVLGVSGIIPARAGFTRRRLGATTGRADHPRSRGVYHTVSRWHLRLAGSSPLARGLRGQR